MLKQRLLNTLQKGLELIENEGIDNLFRLENFKLYDAFFSTKTEKDVDDFYFFCEDEFKIFKDEMLSPNNLKLTQYARTSYRYIQADSTNIDSYDLTFYRDKKYFEQLEFIFNNCICNYIDSDLEVNLVNGKVDSFVYDIDDEYIEDNYDIEKLFDEIISDIKWYIRDEIKDVNKAFEYIDDFKAKQVEYFNDFKNALEEE